MSSSEEGKVPFTVIYRPVKIFRTNHLTNFEKIGYGAFGTVYSAKLKGQGKVAVKSVVTKEEALREIHRLTAANNHPNVLKLIGMVKDYTNNVIVPWLILEYAPKGNLLEYIRNYEGGCPGVGMVLMAHGIAMGMDYIHRRANLVHRDLAARNILVLGEHRWDVKIGDFGLCDEYYENDYSQQDIIVGRPCPLRWMPPESLPDSGSKFSRKGDVWSFGVILFEMWSRGSVPYEPLGCFYAVKAAIFFGHTPLHYATFNVRNYIYNLMLACWEYHPANRPTFRSIIRILEENDPCYFY